MGRAGGGGGGDWRVGGVYDLVGEVEEGRDSNPSTDIYSTDTQTLSMPPSLSASTADLLQAQFEGIRERAERWGVRIMYLGYLIILMNAIAIIMVILNVMGVTAANNLDGEEGSDIHPDAIGHLPTLNTS